MRRTSTLTADHRRGPGSSPRLADASRTPRAPGRLRPIAAPRSAPLFLVAALLSVGCDGASPPAPDAAGDPSTPDAGPNGERCDEGHACNARLLAGGTCPAECVPVAQGPTCHGVVRAGLCFGGVEPPAPSHVALTAPLSAEVVSAPAEARVGETHDFVLRFRNDGGEAVATPFEVTVGAAWAPEDPATTSGVLELGPGESLERTLRLRATEPSALRVDEWLALRWHPTDSPRGGVVIRTPVHVAEGVACGDRRFPSRWTPADGSLGYEQGVCCDEVFHPGGECCGPSDCSGTACVDGTCVQRVPQRTPAPAPLGAPTHVLIVLLDELGGAPAEDPCVDRAPELAEELELSAIEAWLRETFERRTGAAAPPMRWTVHAGIRSEEVGAASMAFSDLAPAVERHLEDRGCYASVDRGFDRIVVASPDVILPDLRDGGEADGLAWGLGRIALSSWSPATVTHELTHTFGAWDLYADLGSRFGRAGALMGYTPLRDPAAYRDDVAWGQIGLGDVNRDGVLDTFEFAHAPDELVLGHAEGLVATAPTEALELVVRIDAVEDGETLLVVPRRLEVELVDSGDAVDVDPYLWRGFPEATRLLVSFGGALSPGVAADVAAAGSVRARVRAEVTFADASFERHTRRLDVTVDVPVEVVGP